MPTKTKSHTFTEDDVVVPNGGNSRPFVQQQVNDLRINASAAWGTPGVAVNGPKGRNIIPIADLGDVIDVLIAIHADWQQVVDLTEVEEEAPARTTSARRKSAKSTPKASVSKADIMAMVAQMLEDAED